ncbi:MAG TPA: chemotaxis protein CheA [Terriglobales bacterium]|nr:chemotaxis protein CheA [Terriglobales bacterium]
MDFDRQAALESFLVETEEGLDQMEQSLLELESDSSNIELVNDIFRVAHTLKGNAVALSLDGLAELAHAAEDLLDVFREQRTLLTRQGISLLLAAVDEFRALLPGAVSGKTKLTKAQLTLKAQIAQHTRQAASAPEKHQSIESAVPAPLTRSVAPAGAGTHTVRADVDRLDHMLNLIGEIVIAQGRVRNTLEKIQHPQAAMALDLHRDAERLYKELQREMMRIRMVPIGPSFRQLKRSVRDLSASHGKIARLEVGGGDVEVDTTVLEHLKDPLLHMIRNAIDHGIEPPEVRERLGKDRCGVLKLSAVHANGNIVVKLEDDGAGINRQKIIDKASQMGLLFRNDQLSDEELLRLLFLAGFSTAKTVSDLSGRGVGLDVVKRNIESLRGSVELFSEEGKGTSLTIRLPLTLAIIDGFSVAVGAEHFIIPSDYVTECAEIAPEARNSEGSGILNLRGHAVPYVRLRESFHVAGQAPDRENVVIVKVGNFDAGIAVDRLIGGMQAVIKPLGKAFRAVPGIAGSTILDDGRVGLIVDVPRLLQEVTPAALRSNLGKQPITKGEI